MDTDKLIMSAIIVLTLGVFAFIGITSFKTVKPTLTPTKETLLRNNPHYKGVDLQTSNLMLVEFSDYQCPACKSLAPYVDSLVNDYKDRLTFVYKHFPLKSIHPLATDAAKASEAAAIQGKFWEYHDELFIESPALTAENLLEYAKRIGLDEQRFLSDFRSEAVSKRVEDDASLADSLNLQGTPTIFIIEGDKVEKYDPRGEDLRVMIEKKLGVQPKNPEQSNMDQSGTEQSQSQPEQQVALAAQLDLLNVQKEGVSPSDIKILSSEQTQWSDSSLGCGETGKSYAQVIVPGYRIVLEAKDKKFEYHTNADGSQVILCGQK